VFADKKTQKIIFFFYKSSSLVYLSLEEMIKPSHAGNMDYK